MVTDWKTAEMPFVDITPLRHVVGCSWCAQAFGQPHTAILVDDGTSAGVESLSVVHRHCLEPMRRRARLLELVTSLAPLVRAYEVADDMLTDHPDYEYGEPPHALYERRDDAGVEVAGHVPELLRLLAEDGLAPTA